ncbi:regulatory-associated protein of mTOR [Pteropus vampyrus]|uniref:Regulatory-associated protein of mTOR n=1 Tax=Pteropus vampyrus TaxID=132908 RepID=A0A6P6BK32_PTEVA|nr:regulatory-associated protein of mTOR [Pteropus vampyrus]
MESEMLQSPLLGLGEEDEADLTDWNLPLAFMKKRHCEKIEGSKSLAQSWRMKDRMKTVSVALVLCLNVGVDPPDVVKTTPCARLECWIDPLSMGPQKALETIGANLQKQYENWQPRARYKQSLDPTVDEVKKLCTSLRRNAKEERVLFHYNGHGVPRPTVNGEIWVFNKNYTQYIPLSVYDLQTWMGSPSIFVYDCSNAGLIVKSFKQFALQREQELEVRLPSAHRAALCVPQGAGPPCCSLPFPGWSFVRCHGGRGRGPEKPSGHTSGLLLPLTSLGVISNLSVNELTTLTGYLCSESSPVPRASFVRLCAFLEIASPLELDLCRSLRFRVCGGGIGIGIGSQKTQARLHPFLEASELLPLVAAVMPFLTGPCSRASVPVLSSASPEQHGQRQDENSPQQRSPLSGSPGWSPPFLSQEMQARLRPFLEASELLPLLAAVMPFLTGPCSRASVPVLSSASPEQHGQRQDDNGPQQHGPLRFCMQKCVSLVPGVTLDLIENFSSLPSDLFQKLFRQDLLVASLFRNFLLAERVMRSCNCTPVSSPRLPPTYMHAMWQAWDLAVDICLSQLPTIIEEGTAFRHSPFFAEQLTAFQVWLTMGVENRSPPEQLPIVLQVLLSQVHRLRALDLLGRFLDLGPWAVSLALSVGIFPYVLKLLQSSARELRPLLVFIWAKILAVDSSCQADLVKDNGHKYFLSVLADPYMPAEHRTMTAFILAVIVNNYNTGQEACLQGNLIAICLEQLSDPHPLLRQWVAICLGRVWQNFDPARWCGVRDSAHEKLCSLLSDPIPEVRCAAVFALGTFVGNSAERTDHSTTIDHNVAMMLAQLINDGSPVVRKELVVALSHLVVQYESNFCTVALQFMEEEKNYPLPSPATTEGGSLTPVRDSPCTPRLRSVSSYGNIRAVTTARNLNKSLQNLSLTEEPGGSAAFSPGNLSTSSSASSTLGSPENEEHILSFETVDKMRRVSSYSALNSLIGVSFNSVYTQIWRVLLHLAADPYPDVSDLAMKVLNSIAYKATVNARPQRILTASSLTQSAPASPTNKGVHIHQAGGSPPTSSASSSSLTNDVAKQPVSRDLPPSRPGATGPVGTQYTPHSHQFPRTRKMFDKGPDQTADDPDDAAGHKGFISATMQTGFCDWSARYFAQPVMKIPEEHDLESQILKEREWRFLRNARVRRQARRLIQKGITRLDDQIFLNRNPGVPSVVKFHPFTPCVAVADKDSICFWDWEKGEKLDYFHNGNPRYTRVTAMEYLNGQDCSLLLTATDDGAIRVWKNFADLEKNPEMVTAWQGLSDMLPTTRGAGMVVDWEQETGLLMSSGDVRIVRIWDTEREMKVQDIPTGADSCVTSLSCDSHRSLIVAGLGDGSIRVYDRRMALSECRVMTYREHTAWVVKVCLQKHPEGHIVSVSVNGDVRFFDPRMPESVNVLQIVKGLTALDIHPQASLIACGSMNQFTAIYNGDGDLINNIKYYDGFMGQRVGAISCLAFHPHWPHLAVGSNDYYISVYSVEKRVR